MLHPHLPDAHRGAERVWNRAGGSGWIGGEGSGIDRYAQRKADDGFFEAEEKAVGVGGFVRRTGTLEGTSFADKADVIQLKGRNDNMNHDTNNARF